MENLIGVALVAGLIALVVAVMTALDQARANAEERLRKIEREIRDARIGTDGVDYGSLGGRISHNANAYNKLRDLVLAIDKRLADAVNNGDVALGEINSRIAQLDRQRVLDNVNAARDTTADLDNLAAQVGLLAEKMGLEFFRELVKRDQIVGSKPALRKKQKKSR